MAKKEMDVRFHKFGTVSFTATTKVNDFIDYLERDGQISTALTARASATELESDAVRLGAFQASDLSRTVGELVSSAWQRSSWNGFELGSWAPGPVPGRCEAAAEGE